MCTHTVVGDSNFIDLKQKIYFAPPRKDISRLNITKFSVAKQCLWEYYSLVFLLIPTPYPTMNMVHMMIVAKDET